ncbi:hypothetical protein N0V95_000861 [Ascochyta clinopodiicola]|uniref:Mitochondrial pyruvate carrier n=1 Tax=Ascochyta lentis TaxID=205686 RepID=A0A8H7MLL0_9PLEO|nr:hypothetical protein EKO04_003539 [Ascochyta lentis]KAJ4364239.1 hypothetical protein N0V95_000861 [Ascochyta clinopodiicola]
MSFRPGSRIFSAFRTNFRQYYARRNASTAPGAEPSGFAKFWASPVGPKTVHFWAPVMKWAMVAAGASDFSRPAESLSLTQNFALMCTGAIWTRWCFVIRPKNVALAAVNALLFCVGATQVGRIYSYNQSLKATDLAKAEGKELETDLKATAAKAEKKLS